MMAANQARPCQSLPLASICATAVIRPAASAFAPAAAAAAFADAAAAAASADAPADATAMVITLSHLGHPRGRGIVCGRRPATFLLLRGQIGGLCFRFSRLPPIFSSQCSSTLCLLPLKVFLRFRVVLKLMSGKVFLGSELLLGSILYRLDESLLNLGESLCHLVRYAHDIVSARLEFGHGTAHSVFKGSH
jgi:hypothetical protein